MAHANGWKTLLPCRFSKSAVADEIPVGNVGLFSYLSYTWLDGFMWRAFRRGLSFDDLWRCPPQDGAEVNADRLGAMWKEEVKTKGAEKASLMTVCLRCAKVRIIVAILAMVLSFTFLLLGIGHLLMTLLSYCRSPEMELWRGIVMVLAVFLAYVLHSVFFVAIFTITITAGARVRSGCLFLLYRKILRVRGLTDDSIGQVLNLYANDSQRLIDGISNFPMLLASPLLALGTTAYAIYLLGYWPLIGLLIICLLFPLQMCLGKLIMKYRAELILVTDRRVRFETELLNNVKFIKTYAWEKPIETMVSDIRKEEKICLEKVNICISLAIVTSVLLIIVATMVTLIAHSFAGNDLNSVQAFTYLAVFNVIQLKIGLSTMAVQAVSEFRVAVNRIQDILLLEETVPQRALENIVSSIQKEHAILFRHATFSWPMTTAKDLDIKSEAKVNGKAPSKKSTGKDQVTDGTELSLLSNSEVQVDKENTDALKDINLKLEKGDIVGVIGAIGSGKTAFISAILGELPNVSGDVRIQGQIAYVPQHPCIFNASLCDNILFGSPMDKKRYDNILDICCLKPDLKILAAGDQTEIGERGVNLSGGQKQRVSLARALYSDRDIYLLDDPFSALDPDVADVIYERVVQGMLIGKTVIMVTHQLKYLSECDYIIYLEGGSVVYQGSYGELMDSREPSSDFFTKLMTSQDHGSDTTAKSQELSDTAERDDSNLSPQATNLSEAGRDLMTTEEQETEAVEAKTYLTYIRAGGGIVIALLILLVNLAAEGCRAFSSWWLAYWLEQGSGNTTVHVGNESYISSSIADHPDWGFYNLIYGISLLAILLLFTFRTVFTVKVLMKASTTLHNLLYKRIFSWPMVLFDTTPLGRIINRFSKDMDELDCRLPPLITITVRSIISVVLYLIMIGVVIYWFLIAVIPVSLIFGAFYVIFRVGARDLKRLQNISMSPLLSHVTATINGLHTLRAYKKQEDFSSRFVEMLDRNSATVLLFSFCLRWINVRLSFLTAIIFCITALTVVLMHGSISAAFAGLAIYYSAELFSMFQIFFTFAIEIEARFTSVERIRSYIEQPVIEEDSKHPPLSPTTDVWPSEGHVMFHGLELRYRKELPLVLNGINCDIKPSEKVGIVGRTGSGKSSLWTALFRLVEPSGGKIEIDGVDIGQLSLENLRSQLSVIPQEPVLFAGTVRTNLDPFNRHIDQELWRALERCYIKELVEKLDGKLDAKVTRNGSNFSLGEKQMLCLTRVLLRHSKVIILDEATASVDTDTEMLLQKALAEIFCDSTLLIIAHRLRLVMECDRVIVIQDGQIVEFDKPSVLLENHQSHFSQIMSLSSQKTLKPDKSQGSEAEAWV